MIERRPSASQQNRRLIALETISSGFRLVRFHCLFQKISNEIDNEKGPLSGPFFYVTFHLILDDELTRHAYDLVEVNF